MSTAVTILEPSADEAQEQLDRWFREYHSFVYRTACAITGRAEDAEDILQTLFLRLMRRSVPPDIRKNPKGYFYKAAVNLSLNTIHLKRREVLTSEFESIPGDVRVFAQHPLDEELVKMLEKLSQRTVEILTLRYLHHYTEPEIAKLLKVSRGTVAVTLFRGRRRLRKLLSASSFRR